MKTYFFETGEYPDQTDYHSPVYCTSEENKVQSRIYCEENKKDVRLISLADGLGYPYGKWEYNDGALKYHQI